MAKRWQLIAHDQQLVADLQQSAKVPAVVAQLLLARGIGHSSLVSGFLESRLSGLRDPHLLPGCSAAAERLFEAIQAGRKIVVYGDYDADGMTAAALLVRCLRMLGAEADVYVPNRLEDGYGLSCDALRSIALADAGTVVTVDCGITSVVEAREARALGLELIVTDHHQFGPTLPEADVLVHPALPGSDYPFTGLAGAGVAFKLAWALCHRLSEGERVSRELPSESVSG